MSDIMESCGKAQVSGQQTMASTPAATAVNGGSIKTSGEQTYNDGLTLGAATTLTSTGSGAITFR